MNEMLDWIGQDPKVRVPLVVALIGICSALMGGFFTVLVWPLVKAGALRFGEKITNVFSGRDFERRYLDWVIKQHRYLPALPTTLASVAERKTFDLDRLYVSLAVSEHAQGADEISVGDALRDNPYLVILGEPGAGKTTMLRFLALTFAKARRKSPSASNIDERKRETPSYRHARRRVSEEFGYENFPLPIFVYLNRLRDVAKWSSGRSLLDALREEWKSIDTLRDFPPRFFDEMLDRGECIFLFDAFDELGTQDARDAIARHIGELASSAPPGNRFVVTSRVVGYNGQLSTYGFDVLMVQRLSWDLISQLVTQWYAALDKGELADDLLETLRTNAGIYELAVNPMLLSLIALVQYIRGLIPDRRDVLYDECVKILVERRYAPHHVQQQYNRLLPGDEAVELLRGIATEMHRAGLREVSRQELEEELIPGVLKAMTGSRATSKLPRDLLNNIEQRSQLIVERGFNENGQPVMAFSHLTFQEYLTSVALKESTGQRGENVVSQELINAYEGDRERWEEVALLYAAQLDGPQRRSFLKYLYPEERDIDTAEV